MVTLCRVVATAVVAVLLTAVPQPPAAATTVDCDGVLVVVDATAVGGGVTAQCAPGSPRTGLDALTAAGFTYTFVPRIPGMVCQINQQPNPCNNAPTDAYWSYWHQDAGEPWRYANEGAGTYTPAVGSVDGWVFGSGNTPPAFERDRDEQPSSADHSNTPAGDTPSESDSTDGPDRDTPDTNDPSDTSDAEDDSPVEDSAAADGENPFEDWPVPPRQLLGAVLVIGGGVALLLSRRSNQRK